MKISGKKLKVVLRIIGISQEKAANSLGISRQTLVTRLQSAELDIDFVQKVNRVLNIDLNLDNSQIVKQYAQKGETGLRFKDDNKRDLGSNENNTMLIGEVPAPGEETNLVPLGNNKFGLTVPLIPVKAYAGYLDNYGDPEYYETLDKYNVTVMGNYRGVYLAFVVSGDSMENYSTEELARASIPEGSIVTGREIQKMHWRNKLHLHRFQFYVIVHNDGILTKQITEHNIVDGYIICHSLNEKYTDRKIMLDDCIQILNIVHKGAAL